MLRIATRSNAFLAQSFMKSNSVMTSNSRLFHQSVVRMEDSPKVSSVSVTEDITSVLGKLQVSHNSNNLADFFETYGNFTNKIQNEDQEKFHLLVDRFFNKEWINKLDQRFVLKTLYGLKNSKYNPIRSSVSSQVFSDLSLRVATTPDPTLILRNFALLIESGVDSKLVRKSHLESVFSSISQEFDFQNNLRFLPRSGILWSEMPKEVQKKILSSMPNPDQFVNYQVAIDCLIAFEKLKFSLVEQSPEVVNQFTDLVLQTMVRCQLAEGHGHYSVASLLRRLSNLGFTKNTLSPALREQIESVMLLGDLSATLRALAGLNIKWSDLSVDKQNQVQTAVNAALVTENAKSEVILKYFSALSAFSAPISILSAETLHCVAKNVTSTEGGVEQVNKDIKRRYIKMGASVDEANALFHSIVLTSAQDKTPTGKKDSAVATKDSTKKDSQITKKIITAVGNVPKADPVVYGHTYDKEYLLKKLGEYTAKNVRFAKLNSMPQDFLTNSLNKFLPLMKEDSKELVNILQSLGRIAFPWSNLHNGVQRSLQAAVFERLRNLTGAELANTLAAMDSMGLTQNGLVERSHTSSLANGVKDRLLDMSDAEIVITIQALGSMKIQRWMPTLLTLDTYSAVTAALLTYLPQLTPHEVASVVNALAHGRGEQNEVAFVHLSEALQTQLLVDVERVFAKLTPQDEDKLKYSLRKMKTNQARFPAGLMEKIHASLSHAAFSAMRKEELAAWIFDLMYYSLTYDKLSAKQQNELIVAVAKTLPQWVTEDQSKALYRLEESKVDMEAIFQAITNGPTALVTPSKEVNISSNTTIASSAPKPAAKKQYNKVKKNTSPLANPAAGVVGGVTTTDKKFYSTSARVEKPFKYQPPKKFEKKSKSARLNEEEALEEDSVEESEVNTSSVTLPVVEVETSGVQKIISALIKLGPVKLANTIFELSSEVNWKTNISKANQALIVSALSNGLRLMDTPNLLIVLGGLTRMNCAYSDLDAPGQSALQYAACREMDKKEPGVVVSVLKSLRDFGLPFSLMTPAKQSAVTAALTVHLPHMAAAEVCSALSCVGHGGSVKFSALDKAFQAEVIKTTERVVETGEVRVTVDLLGSLGCLGVSSEALPSSTQETIDAALVTYLASETGTMGTSDVVRGLAGTKFEMSEELDSALISALGQLNKPTLEFVTKLNELDIDWDKLPAAFAQQRAVIPNQSVGDSGTGAAKKKPKPKWARKEASRQSKNAKIAQKDARSAAERAF